MLCKNLILSSDNYIETADLTTNVEPVTDINNVKNHHRGRLLKWDNLTENFLQINCNFEQERYISYFAIAGHNLPNDARVLFQLYDNDGNPVYSSPWMEVGQMLPLGIFRSGIDPYGSREYAPFNDLITYFLDDLIKANRCLITIDHNYNYVPPDAPEPIIVSDGIYRQNESNRSVVIEAENAESIPNGSDVWQIQNEAGASGSAARYKAGNAFYWSNTEGPRIRFTFNATVSGAYKIWVRLKSDDGNSMYTFVDGVASTHFFQGNALVGQGWIWDDIRQINLIAGQQHTFIIAARDHRMLVDKMVILPVANPSPTGTGPVESGFGQTVQEGFAGAVSSTDNVAIRMAMCGNTIQLEKNFSHDNVIQFVDDPNLITTTSGYSVESRVQNLVKRMTLEFEQMTDTDRLTLSQFEKRNLGKPFLVSPYPNRAGWFRDDYIFLARFGNALGYSHHRENIHQTSAVLLEV